MPAQARKYLVPGSCASWVSGGYRVHLSGARGVLGDEKVQVLQAQLSRSPEIGERVFSLEADVDSVTQRLLQYLPKKQAWGQSGFRVSQTWVSLSFST